MSPGQVRRLVRKGQIAAKRLSKTYWLIQTASLKKFAEAM